MARRRLTTDKVRYAALVIRTHFKTSVLPLVLACAFGLAGCGVSIGSYCEEAALCENGNELDEEACNIAFEAEEERGALKGCDAEFDEYFECLGDFSRCNEDRYRPDPGECETQEDQYATCVFGGGS